MSEVHFGNMWMTDRWGPALNARPAPPDAPPTAKRPPFVDRDSLETYLEEVDQRKGRDNEETPLS